MDTGDPSRPALRSVAVVIDHGVSMFELAIPCEVFGIDRSADGIPPFEFSICSPTPGPVRTSIGFHIVATHDLSALETADLVIVPPLGVNEPEDACSSPQASPEVNEALSRVLQRGGRVASLCSGAFILARAGLLDGRRATTHWFHADAFADEFPHVELECDVLYVEDGPVVTSAGTAAGIDMCLHLVRQAHGAEAANGIARRMVVPPQRDGGQAQFVRTPVREAPARTLAPVLDWARGRLHEDLSVTRLARQAVMSERTFARRFRDETGTTPHQWVQRERIALAEQLLEGGDLAIEEVARRSGFASAAMLRHHFGRRRRTTPGAYRRTFSTSA
ncbi:GlxA family transcriptional regulator [Spongisporangium articulatum]|uniref:GlxA family transcriptional regulator n=1 Tax=Spongisporangium articulatum TaxID=3362603 RepID=A0ABW8ARZ0_9ACTN